MYEPPAPHLIKTPKTRAGLQLHQKYAFNNLTYFQKHVLGNDVQSCYDTKHCYTMMQQGDPSHFHGVWNFHAENFSILYESSSRGHIKTTWTQSLNAWDMIRYPVIHNTSFHNVQVSYAKEQAKKWHTGKSGKEGLRGMIEHAIDNLELDLKFGNDAKTELSLEGMMTYHDERGRKREIPNNSSSTGTSMGGNIRMEHTDRVTLDDIINDRMTMSIADAEGIVRGAIFGTRTPGAQGRNTQIVYIGTIVAEGDPLDQIRKGELGSGMFRGEEFTGILPDDHDIWRNYVRVWQETKVQLLDNAEYYAYEDELIEQQHPNIINEMTKFVMRHMPVDTPIPRVLWPEKRPLDYHIEQWYIQGEIYYEREYLLKLTNEQQALFKRWMIDEAKRMGENYKLRRQPHPDGVITIGCDFSIGTSSSSDYNVIFVNEWVDNYEIPLDIIRFRGFEMKQASGNKEWGKKGELEDEIERQIKMAIDTYAPGKSVAEENGFQRTIGNSLRKADYNITAYNTGGEKHQMTVGIPGLDKPLKDRRFIIPSDPTDSYTIEETKVFIKEMQSMQWDPSKQQFYSTVKPKGSPDTIMAWWMSRIAKEKYGQGKIHFLAH